MATKYTLQEVRDYVSSIGFELLSNEYINNAEFLQIKCREGHCFDRSFSALKNNKSKDCPVCRGKKYTINKVREPEMDGMEKFHIDKEVLIQEYVINKKSTREIGKLLNCSSTTVGNKLKFYGIPFYTPTERASWVEDKIDKQLLLKLYNENISFKELSKKFGLAVRTLNLYIKQLGAEPRYTRKRQDLRQDLTGRKFGKLTVVKLDKIIDDRFYYWWCQCSCDDKLISLDAVGLLRSRGYGSCGCRHGNVDWEIIPPFLWSRIIKGANIRNIEFKVTREEAEQLFISQNKKCYFSGLELQFGNRSGKETTASLDRIDSKKDYTLENLKWVHKTINLMKGSLENDIFVKFCLKIADNFTNKDIK